MSRRVKLSQTAYALVSAIILTLLSVLFERVGPELVQYGVSIYKPVLKGGFPLAYLFDLAGVSVERKLAPEDELFVSGFIIDVAFYFVIVLLGMAVVRYHRAGRMKGTNRASN